MFSGCRDFGFGGYWGGLFMPIIQLILIGIVVYIVFKLFNQLKYSEAKNNSQAINTLMERYALGEISEEEYLRKKKLIER